MFDPLSARVASHLSWARERDRRARTAPARDAMRRKFVERARELLGQDATGEQVRQSAESLRKAHYADLARRSAQARRNR